MFVFLSKLLPPLAYPLGLAILLVLAALLLRKRPRLRTAAEVIALILLVLSSNHWVSFLLARSLEWQYLPNGEIPSAEVIVLLGGGTEPAIYPRTFPELNGAGDRLVRAANLYHQGKAPAILASGGNITWMDSQISTPASDMTVLLERMGVPSTAIWQEDRSQNTYENAVYCANILKEKKITRVILVTSALHMPRSVAIFRKLGVDVIPAPADFAVTQEGWAEITSTPEAWLVNLLPSAGSLGLTSAALKEYFGLLVYRLRGWA